MESRGRFLFWGNGMSKITYVCGHRNPDTDSIVAAIAYAALQNILGENGYVPARLGTVNDETAALLKRFGFQTPMHLNTVRTQVKDLDFDRPPQLGRDVPVSRAWGIMQENPGLSALPVTMEDGTLFGLVTAGGIAESDMRAITQPVLQDAPVLNVLSALEGRILNKEEDGFETLSGEVMIALPAAGEPLRGVNEESIVLCGEQVDMINLALRKKVRCLILC